MSTHLSDPSLSGRATHGISAAETLMGSEGPAPKLGDRLARGATVGRYIVLDLLGRGGMGVVYTAYDPELDRKVALKLLLPGRDRRPGARLRLQREAQAIARLAHPNVVAVHDVGAMDDRVFIAMEFVDGTDLAHWLQEGPRESAQVLMTYLQAGEGLSAAHAAGLAHRDFKPENVLLGVDGRARVVDFGLVREDDSVASRGPDEDPAMLEVSQRRLEGSDLRLTDAGTLVGTPAYMSPEQFMGDSGDARSDQFSFCVALYEGLYGERPFAGEDVAELSMTVLDGKIRAAPASSRVQGRLRRVLLRGLARAPEDRYPGMPALLAALRKASAPRRRWWIVPAALGLGGLGALAMASQLGDDEALRCDDGEARWQAIWGPEQQAELEQAFVRTDLPYARDTWERVRARVDERLGRWVEQDRQLCEQTSALGPTTMAEDPRRHCLDDRFAETADLLAIFYRAQPQTVTGAITMTHGLHAVECTRADTSDAPPTPSDPVMAESVEQVRSELRRWRLEARATPQADHNPEALQQLADRATALGYEPLDAEVLLTRASAAEEVGKLDDATTLANQAFETALGCRHDTLAFRAATNLLFMHGLLLREADPGHRWGRRAQALERRLGYDHGRHLQLHSNWAAVYTIYSDQEQARHHYDEALSTVRAMDEPTHLATVLNNIGSFHAKHRRTTVGLDYLQEAAALNEDLYGPDHPVTLRTSANLGIVSVMDGQFEDGLARLERVLPRQEAVLGPASADLMPTFEGMAVAYTRFARFEEALAVRQRAVEVRRSLHGPAHALTLAARSNLADTLIQAGKHQRARRVLEEIEPHVDTLDQSQQVQVLTNLGIALGRLAEPGASARAQLARSSDYTRRAITLCESTDRCTPALRAEVLDAAGWGALRTHDHDTAKASFSRVADEADTTIPTRLWLSARRGLVFVQFEEDREAALDLARQTLDDPRSAEGPRGDLRAREQARALTRWLSDPRPFGAIDAEG